MSVGILNFTFYLDAYECDVDPSNVWRMCGFPLLAIESFVQARYDVPKGPPRYNQRRRKVMNHTIKMILTMIIMVYITMTTLQNGGNI